MWPATKPEYKTYTQHFYIDPKHQDVCDKALNTLCNEEAWRVINSWQFEAESHIFRSYLLQREVIIE